MISGMSSDVPVVAIPISTHKTLVSCPFSTLTFTKVSTHRHAVNRMVMTARSRCIMRLYRSPILFIQPYLWRSKA